MSEEMNLYKRCKNIFKFHGVDMGGGGGEPAPEVENAIETHGLGWTDTEEKAGFDIQWDGNTEGLETFLFSEGFNPAYKVSDKIVTSMESLIGSKFTLFVNENSYDYEMPTNNGAKTLTNLGDSIKEMLPSFPDIFAFGLDVEHDFPLGYILPVDTDVDEEDFDIHIHASAGIYFAKFDLGGTQYVISHLYKEATTEEVVHQIDQKYIPGGSGGTMFVTVVFDDNLVGTADKTLSELATAYESGMNVIATIEAFNTTIAKVSCIQYADGGLLFGTPLRTDDDGWCLVPLKVTDSGDADLWETTMI